MRISSAAVFGAPAQTFEGLRVSGVLGFKGLGSWGLGALGVGGGYLGGPWGLCGPFGGFGVLGSLKGFGAPGPLPGNGRALNPKFTRGPFSAF